MEIKCDKGQCRGNAETGKSYGLKVGENGKTMFKEGLYIGKKDRINFFVTPDLTLYETKDCLVEPFIGGNGEWVFVTEKSNRINKKELRSLILNVGLEIK